MVQLSWNQDHNDHGFSAVIQPYYTYIVSLTKLDWYSLVEWRLPSQTLVYLETRTWAKYVHKQTYVPKHQMVQLNQNCLWSSHLHALLPCQIASCD